MMNRLFLSTQQLSTLLRTMAAFDLSVQPSQLKIVSSDVLDYNQCLRAIDEVIKTIDPDVSFVKSID